MPMLEGRVDAVIGVDTHRDSHAAALLDPNGGVRATLAVPSDRAGHARLLQLAVGKAPGRRVWATMASGWSRSIGPGGRVAATVPRATPWTRFVPAAKRWPAST